MIKETIDEVKDLVDGLGIPDATKLTLQRLLTVIRSELLFLDAQAAEARARQDVYADVCNKMMNRLTASKYD